MSAGDLSALGEDADRVVAVESLSVPAGGGGVGGEMGVSSSSGRVSALAGGRMGRAEVAAGRADEPEPARAVGEDLKLPRVVGDVVAFT